MARQYPCVHQSLTDALSVEIEQQLERMNTHQAQADTLSQQAKTTSETGVISVWSSPEQLRTWSQAQQQAQQCFDSVLQRGAWRGRVMFRAYQHSAWCAVRAVVPGLLDSVRLTLAQVARLFTPVNPAHDHDPPGLLLSCSVLATCQASNAPGLSPVVRSHWQVRPRE